MPLLPSEESKAAVETQIRRLVDALRKLPLEAEPAATFDVMAPPDYADQPDE
jgi:hypothetical protein